MARSHRFSVLGLQIAIAVFGLVPVAAGCAGALLGPAMLGPAALGDATGAAFADSHFRYLSGLLLAVGLLFWSAVPGIERRSGRVRLLTAIVVLGGLARLAGVLMTRQWSPPIAFALAMELGVTPGICLWQSLIAGRRRRG
jgi:hypothetical protein